MLSLTNRSQVAFLSVKRVEKLIKQGEICVYLFAPARKLVDFETSKPYRRKHIIEGSDASPFKVKNADNVPIFVHKYVVWVNIGQRKEKGALNRVVPGEERN